MTKKPVLMLTHVTAGDAGEMAAIFARLGHPVETRRLNKDAALPENIADYAGFVSFGGPVSANDEHLDYIRAELDWMPRVMAQGTPLLGVCLGAQILARSLGANVKPHAEGLYEFGPSALVASCKGTRRCKLVTVTVRASNCPPAHAFWRRARVSPIRRSATALPALPCNFTLK